MQKNYQLKIRSAYNYIPLNKELYVSISKIISIDDKNTIELRVLDSFRLSPSILKK